VVASRKDPALQGVTMLLIQPLTNDHKPQGKALVALDSVGAGVTEEVFYVRGREAAYPFMPNEVPSDATIVGIVDEWTA
jgi:microcompartment protein CcmK/EutM